MAEAAARPAVRFGTAPSTRFPDRNFSDTTHHEHRSNEARKTMAKFSGTNHKPLRANLTAPVRTRARACSRTSVASATRATRESDLFLLAATNMVGEDTFYERRRDRDHALREARARGDEDEPGVPRRCRRRCGQGRSRAVPPRDDAHALGDGRDGSRVRGRRRRGRPLGGRARPAACRTSRPRWSATGSRQHGRNLPMPIKRGVADAARRLYNERAVLRYDGLTRQTVWPT